MIGAHRNPEGGFTMRRDETPTRRVNPSGKVRWVARYTDRAGRRRTAEKPGTFEKEGPCKKPADDGTCCAQHRIWWAYEQDVPVAEKPVTVRSYFEDTWLQRHPRGERTELNYKGRVKAVLDVKGFGDLPVRAVRVRHLDDLVDVMLREHGRAASGVRGVLAVLSALFTDAIRDDVGEMNPALYVSVRENDPRVQKESRDAIVVSWQEMRRFAMCAGQYEPMVRVLGDCGLRLGEMLALECKHVRGDVLVVEQSAWRGVVTPGTKQGRRREVPISPGLGTLLALARRDRIGLLFPNPEGGAWHERAFYRHVWGPAREASGLDINCHDLRHSFVTQMGAAGVDRADLASATGHTVQTADRYTHSTGGTFDLMRKVAG